MSVQTLRSKRGFTLIELIIVIALIAILASIGLSVYSGQQKNARDAKRRGDIEAIANALETNKTATSYQPLIGSNFTAGAIPTDPGGFGSATPPHYSICYSSSSTTLASGAGYNPPSAWSATSQNPSLATGNCVGNAWSDISTSAPTGTFYSFTICAQLEAGGFYCRSNGQ